MLHLLTQPRWRRLAAATVVALLGCLALGWWQFDRLQDRRNRNALVAGNLAQPAVAISGLVQPGLRLPEDLEWRRVKVTGTYDTARTLLVRNRPLQGTGYHVVVPLVPPEGPAVLVVRGWMPVRAAVPAAPAGQVTVVGRLRVGEVLQRRQLGLDETAPRSVRRVDPALLSAELPYPALSVLVEAAEESPPGAGLLRLPAPAASEGAHLAYAVQWAFFGILAVGGFVVLLRREAAEENREAAEEDADHEATAERVP